MRIPLILALALLAACERTVTSHVAFSDGTGGSATVVERVGPPPARPFGMVDADGRSSASGRNLDRRK